MQILKRFANFAVMTAENIADNVTKVHAICVKCGNLAYVSHRTVEGSQRVLLGETAEYEPLCRTCYQNALQEEKSK